MSEIEPNTEEYELKLTDTLKKIISKKDLKAAREFIDETPTADIANVLDELELNQQLVFLALLKTPDAAELFSYLDDETQKKLAQSFTEEWGMKILQELQSDELADVLEELPANVTNKILAYTPADKRSDINRILRFNDDEVGSIMSIDISNILNTYTCEQALHKIRRDYKANKAELVHYYFVVDHSTKLLGSITLEDIIFADPNTKIDDIYSPVASVSTNDKKEQAAQVFSEHDMSVLPVINNDKRLVGMITSDDVIDVIQDNATEDIYKMHGINAKDATENEYMKTPWYKLVKSRVLWLSILLIIATFIQAICHFAIYKIDQQISNSLGIGASAAITIAFAALIPILNNTTSDGGIQSNISISRSLALKELERKDYGKAILKEFIVGVVLGLIMALINFGRLSIYFAATKDLMGEHAKIYWAIIGGSSLALFLSLAISKLFGAIMPIALAKLKKDPTSLASSFVNILTDTITTLLVFGMLYGFIQLAI